jgi:hypothetical protein
MEEIVSALDELFVIFNFKFFGGDLIKPVIAVQSNQHRNPATMGWCTIKKTWRNTETKEEYYEIALCPEFFDFGVIELSDTFLHELIHLYHLQNGIQGCSRGGHYHNKNFKEKAEEIGLFCEKSGKNGWAITSLKPETKTFVESLNIDRDAFKLIKKRLEIFFQINGEGGNLLGQEGNVEETPETPAPRQSYRKYVCPACKMAVRATKDVNVKCGDCDLTMQKQEQKTKRLMIGMTVAA